eukprot:13925398-Alexandrium_andersonii.AAC.1
MADCGLRRIAALDANFSWAGSPAGCPDPLVKVKHLGPSQVRSPAHSVGRLSVCAEHRAERTPREL